MTGDNYLGHQGMPMPGLLGHGLLGGTSGPAPVRAPHLDSHEGAGGGRTATALADLTKAGLHPAEAFGAAAGLHKLIGHDPIHQRLAGLAAGPPPPPEPKKGKGGKGKGGKGKKAVQEAKSTLADALKSGEYKKAAAHAGGVAAKRGGQLGAKLALRAGAMTIPGLGAAVTAACWVLDPSERSAINNLVARVVGGGSPAPGLDEPPSPPRTQFLPVAHDGNRDPSIVRMDEGMVRTNAAAFQFHPDDVWPSSPQIDKTSDFASVATAIAKAQASVGALAESVRAAYTAAAADEPYLQQLWSRVKPNVDALDELKATVLPAVGRQLMAGAENANRAYQAFRAINAANRVAIHNSTSGLIPFRANHIDATRMSNSADELRSATEAMDRTAQALAAAADPFRVTPYAGLEIPDSLRSSTTPTNPIGPVTPSVAVVPDVTDASKVAGQPTSGPQDLGKDLASLLKNGMPGMPMMPGMPTMPTMPGLGSGMPGGLGSAMPRPADATLARGLQDPLKKALDDQLKEKAEKVDEKVAKKPGDGPLGTPVVGSGAGAAQPAAHKPGPALGAPGTPGGPPGAANTTEIGGKKWTFDNPKAAALAHNLSGTDGSSHKSLRQAAAEAGYRLPPPGQDIGTPVAGADIKPGDVVMGANNQNAHYLGEQDGKAMVITERGELKPLDEVAKFTNAHEGIFRLADDGAPAPEEQVIQQTSGHVEPPAAPPAAHSTDPGIIPTPPRGGQPGMDPGAAPAGN
ncbi:hypothetical protein KV112_20705 [Mycolicibacter sp. MYC123]|uniref:Uncharacterized protein n=1 Tax=[Mycobacterium] zoologicum TaxID=2872311 RepID=A0ABU5YRU3_9MYCO|nr:hypothetical protein [Mycolicibacter sp. MYC123]MEB3052134.1 hypothetical protein [Mycolicibacter sp. MYC123]